MEGGPPHRQPQAVQGPAPRVAQPQRAAHHLAGQQSGGKAPQVGLQPRHGRHHCQRQHRRPPLPRLGSTLPARGAGCEKAPAQGRPIQRPLDACQRQHPRCERPRLQSHPASLPATQLHVVFQCVHRKDALPCPTFLPTANIAAGCIRGIDGAAQWSVCWPQLADDAKLRQAQLDLQRVVELDIHADALPRNTGAHGGWASG
mmetsp:Transcript_11628/g.34931  ORF Transcript_11628/g.34931 Transcript_11628/m.34931 type:complete len:202 (-) Transcript_11628:1216-1821(-)